MKVRGASLLGMLGLVGALLLAELSLRAADAAGWISAWHEAREARRSSIWMASDDPALLYRHRPDYERDGTRYTERHGILRPHDVSPEPTRGSFRIDGPWQR